MRDTKIEHLIQLTLSSLIDNLFLHKKREPWELSALNVMLTITITNGFVKTIDYNLKL